ncbi:hypothetical protein GCM10027511_04800 [Hymenobacter humi]
MEKLPKILFAAMLGMFAWGTPAAAQAQTISNLPPWMNKKVETPAPQPQSYPTNAPVEVRTEDGRRVYSDGRTYRTSEYRNAEYRRKGHPHGMPPGQAKKLGYRANPSNGGLPPGQAKKMGGHGHGKGKH